MRYAISIPAQPVDPRTLELGSNLMLNALLGEDHNHGTEEAAAAHVRSIWPDAIVVPVPVRIGSGKVVMLGVLPSIYGFNRDASEYPFVAVVRPIAEYGEDRKKMKEAAGGFSRTIWRVPVDTRGEEIDDIDVEVRATDLDTPVLSSMTARTYPTEPGLRGGRVVFEGAVLGHRMSVSFDVAELLDIAVAANMAQTQRVRDL